MPVTRRVKFKFPCYHTFSGCPDPLQASAQQDRRLHHASHEEAAAVDSPWHLHQAAGGGEGEEGQLRARRLRPRAGHHRGRLRDQGDAQDDGLPEHPRPPAPEQQGRRIRQQELEEDEESISRDMLTSGRMSRRRQ